MSASLATVSYIGATILFILSLGGLSNQQTALRGNLYGMIGMTLAVLATVFGPQVTWAGIPWIIGAMLVGGAIGLYAARTVQMTQMPELVALMHSMVGLAAMLVGIATFIDPTASFHLVDGKSIPLSSAEESIHKIEIYIGILIGAVEHITLINNQSSIHPLLHNTVGEPLATTYSVHLKIDFHMVPDISRNGSTGSLPGIGTVVRIISITNSRCSRRNRGVTIGHTSIFRNSSQVIRRCTIGGIHPLLILNR